VDLELEAVLARAAAWADRLRALVNATCVAARRGDSDGVDRQIDAFIELLWANRERHYLTRENVRTDCDSYVAALQARGWGMTRQMVEARFETHHRSKRAPKGARNPFRC
jgi:hypothetical protein